jgi:BirA family transcriptional regulator, biotin operon repressor / biotin---[acetyl-CoA-carboxylase] ligase
MSDLRWFPPSLIDEAALVSAIRDLPRFGIVRYSVGTDSTQSRALEVLHRLDARGISFVTESQDVGRGRGGRHWSSPPASGLLFSTILPLDLGAASLPAVGFWTSLCVADAVRHVCGVTLDMKWPNDLLLGARKCGGVLIEGRSTGQTTRAVVGVGLNVNRPAQVPADLPAGASWLSDATGSEVDRTVLLAAVLRTYESTFDELIARPASVVDAWASRSGLVGRRVTVKAIDGTLLHEGAVSRVLPNGALELQTDAGVVPVLLGDVDVLS